MFPRHLPHELAAHGALFRHARIVDGAPRLDNPAAGPYRGCTVFNPRRTNSSGVALETLVPHERVYRRSLADEVAIDFPSSRAAIEFFRRDHVEPDGHTTCTHAEITISANEAGHGVRVPLEVRVPRTCACCGGRGEVWSERCAPCDGRGEELHQRRLTVAVPAGVGDGDRFSFSVSVPRGPRTRVDVRVAVMPPHRAESARRGPWKA